MAGQFRLAAIYILRAIDDQPIGTMTTLSTLLQEYAVGDVVNMRLYRAGAEIAVRVTLSERSIG